MTTNTDKFENANERINAVYNVLLVSNTLQYTIIIENN